MKDQKQHYNSPLPLHGLPDIRLQGKRKIMHEGIDEGHRVGLFVYMYT